MALSIHPFAALASDVTLCAATSLREPLQQVVTLYERDNPGTSVLLHCAGSTALRRQIEAGGPCDVFVAASTDEIDSLTQRGLIERTQVLAGNRLVLFGRRDAATALKWNALQRTPTVRFALGDPRTAPVGRYALEALTTAGLEETLRPRLLPCADALQVTAAVSSGAAAAGFAYRTDLAHDPELVEWDVVPDSLYPPVAYSLALLERGAANSSARRLFETVGGASAAAVLQRFGFTMPPRVAGQSPRWSAPSASTTAQRWGPRNWHPLWLSLRVATLATLLAGSFGLALAAALVRARPGWPRDLMAACTDLPLVLPPSVLGIVLLELCGSHGFVGRHLPFPLAFTWEAAVLASSIVALPLMIRPSRSALEAVPRRYVQAARTLGAGPWRVFWRVRLPLARRGVLAGLLLAFFRALGEFGATLMVAGNIPGRTQTLPLAIYDALFLGQTREALWWVLGVMLLTFVGAVLAQRLHGGAS